MKPQNPMILALKFSASVLLAPALAGSLLAGPVNFIFLSKNIEYEQTSATKVSTIPSKWRPYGFSAEVDGEDRASIARLSPKPTIKLPPNAKFSKIYNGQKPSLGLGADDDDGWNFGVVGDKDGFENWSTRTRSELNSAFPNGNYIFTVQGKTINLSLPRDAYPTAPKMVLSGGRWVKGAYRIKTNQVLTINSGTYTSYGTHLNDYLGLDMENDTTGDDVFEQGQVAKKLAGGPPVAKGKSIIRKVPANTLQAGTTYYIYATYNAIVSQSSALPGATAIGSYEVSTEIKVVAERP
jgi:hypothetical protein